MDEVYVIRYGEISLKGKNRIDFEKKLVDNIKRTLKKNNIEFTKIERVRNRLYVYCNPTDIFRYIFGIVSYSKAIIMPFDLGTIKKAAKDLLAEHSFETFRISTKRMDTTHTSSMEVDKEIGAFVVEEFNKKVSLKEFDIELGIEIRDKKAYMFLEKKRGPAGLPVGISGTVLCKIENNSSILAALLVMKRGCNIVIDNPNNIDLSLLEKYYPFELSSGEGEAIVVGDTVDNFTDYGNEFILRPLIAYSEQEIETMLEAYA